MTRELKILTEQEKTLKKLYQNGGQKMLSSPMQYARYKELVEEHPEYLDLVEFYEEASRCSQGNTILDVKELVPGDDIFLTAHERYGYPILHNHSYIEIAYVYGGACTHYVEKQSFPMTEGDLCILAPEASHVITALGDDVIILNIMVSKEVLNSSFLKMVREKHLLADFFENVLYRKQVSPYIIFPTGKDPLLKHLILEMYRETEEKKYAYQESLKLYFRQLFIHVLRYYETSARVSAPLEPKAEDIIVPVLGYIAANYNRGTLREVASFFNYSEAYMSRMLKNYTGKTYGMLITDLQMRHAREMLKNSAKSLTQIAQEVGCFDYSHFSRKFKKAYGLSPDAYRKSR